MHILLVGFNFDVICTIAIILERYLKVNQTAVSTIDLALAQIAKQPDAVIIFNYAPCSQSGWKKISGKKEEKINILRSAPMLCHYIRQRGEWGAQVPIILLKTCPFFEATELLEEMKRSLGNNGNGKIINYNGDTMAAAEDVSRFLRPLLFKK